MQLDVLGSTASRPGTMGSALELSAEGGSTGWLRSGVGGSKTALSRR